MDNWRLNRIKAVEENIFAWGHEMQPGMKCSSTIPQVENAMTHATSYIEYADRINKISLYESRINRIIVRNTDLLNKRQAERRERVSQPEAAPIAETLTQTAGATAAATSEPSEQAAQTKTLESKNGFAFIDSLQPEAPSVEPFIALDDIPKAA